MQIIFVMEPMPEVMMPIRKIKSLMPLFIFFMLLLNILNPLYADDTKEVKALIIAYNKGIIKASKTDKTDSKPRIYHKNKSAIDAIIL